jgi:hypothetical protein
MVLAMQYLLLYCPSKSFSCQRSNSLRFHSAINGNQVVTYLQLMSELVGLLSLRVGLRLGGPRWTRTTDLTLIRGAL